MDADIDFYKIMNFGPRIANLDIACRLDAHQSLGPPCLVQPSAHYIPLGNPRAGPRAPNSSSPRLSFPWVTLRPGPGPRPVCNVATNSLFGWTSWRISLRRLKSVGEPFNAVLVPGGPRKASTENIDLDELNYIIETTC